MFSKAALIKLIDKLETRILINSELGNDDICNELDVQLKEYNRQLSIMVSDENALWLAAHKMVS